MTSAESATLVLHRETYCEHGDTEPHWPTTDSLIHDEAVRCPGGSREVVTIDYAAAADEMDRQHSGGLWSPSAIVDAALGLRHDH